MKTFKKIYNSLPANGWLTENEAKVLWEYVNKTEGAILEVGCYQGRSSCLLAHTERPVYCVDPFVEFTSEDVSGQIIKSRFLVNIKERGFTNIELFSKKIEDWIPCQVGFCYLDGDHTYQGTINQINKAIECNPQYIAIHDVNDKGGGKAVKEAAIEKLGKLWVERVERLCVWKT